MDVIEKLICSFLGLARQKCVEEWLERGSGLRSVKSLLVGRSNASKMRMGSFLERMVCIYRVYIKLKCWS